MTKTHEEWLKIREQLTKEVKETEWKNRTHSMKMHLRKTIFENVDDFSAKNNYTNIKIVEANKEKPAIAVYRDPNTGLVTAAPIDPIVISEYAYDKTQHTDQERAETHENNEARLNQKGVTISGALELVDEVTDSNTQISKQQLIELQTLMGNNSTWWPIKAYSDKEFNDAFAGLELRVIYRESEGIKIPVGVAHFDRSKVNEGEVKIVFVALAPALHGQGIGKAVFQEMMHMALEIPGVTKLTLDTVHHRDVQSTPGKETASNKGAAGLYEICGFRLTNVQKIDPANLQGTGIEINQLNGPIECFAKNLDSLRAKVYKAFELPVKTALETIVSVKLNAVS